MGANSTMIGDVTAATTVALGADPTVSGNVESKSSSITVGVKGRVGGTIDAATSVTLSAGSSSCGTVTAPTATLGAGAFVEKNINVVTATLAADSYVIGILSATTATLGAGACYGSKGEEGILTLTEGAGAGSCE